MITGGSIGGDSNWARKAHGRSLENYDVNTSQGEEEGSQIGFKPQDLRGVETPHNGALVIHTTFCKL